MRWEQDGVDLRQSWMKAALRLAQTSQDPSTQNGAIIVFDQFHAVGSGVNGWPRRVTGTWERPAKYHYVEHAERAAIYSAARLGERTRGTTMICPWAACSDCARAIVAADIRCLFRLPAHMFTPNDSWTETCEYGDDILRQAGVEVVGVEIQTPAGVTIRHNGSERSL